MAYFLKKATLQGRTYLSICESFYSPEKKGTAHRTYRSLSSLETLKASGIEDPITYFQQEVDRLNKERNDNKTPKIGNVSPILHMGFFPLHAVLNKLNIKPTLDLFNTAWEMKIDLYSILSNLIYASSIKPNGERKTLYEVLPNLYNAPSISFDTLMDAVAVLGNNYEKIVEIFNEKIKKVYGRNIEQIWFHPMDFHVNTTLVRLYLLLDSDLIPLGLSIYTDDESNMDPQSALMKLKKRNNIEGRSIHILNTDLNLETAKTCEKELYDALQQFQYMEESFYTMSAEPEALPLVTVSEESIKGYFTICFLRNMLEKLLQTRHLQNRFSNKEIHEFMQDFNIVKAEHSAINTLTDSKIAIDLETRTGLPIRNASLSETKLKTIMNYRF